MFCVFLFMFCVFITKCVPFLFLVILDMTFSPASNVNTMKTGMKTG